MGGKPTRAPRSYPLWGIDGETRRDSVTSAADAKPTGR